MRLLAIFLAFGLGLPADSSWRTYGGDAQRTGWAKDEKTITKANASKLRLAWSAQLDNAPIEVWSLTTPVVSAYNYTPAGVQDIVIVGGSSDMIYGLDADNGHVIWQKHFDRQGEPPNKGSGGWLCPNALISTPYIDTDTKTVYSLSSDGRLHSLNVVNGEDKQAPVQFVPPFSKAWSLNLVNGVLYTGVSQGCSGPHDGVYAMNLRDPARPVATFRTYGGVWGRGGISAGPENRIYAEVGDGPFHPEEGKFSDVFLALEPRTLKLADWYAPKNQVFIDKKDLDMGNVTPIIFRFKGRDLVAGSGKEGAIFLLDAKSLGGEDHRTPLYRSDPFTNEEANLAGRGVWGEMTTWEANGGRWLLAPAYGPQHGKSAGFQTVNGDAPDGSMMAFRVEEKDGKPVVVPAWRSPNMVAPDPGVYANGVVFAVASGDGTRQIDKNGQILNSKQRMAESVPAVLYALDAETGKPLFSSGSTLKTFTHFSGVAISEGRVFVVTYDGKVSCFSVPD
jgi:outer membrane protein assembly factor BamB